MFQTAKANNISVVRMFATGIDQKLPLQLSPGQYNDAALKALDQALDSAARNGVMVTLIFARNWQGPDSKRPTMPPGLAPPSRISIRIPKPFR